MKGIEEMTRNYLEDESYKVASAQEVHWMEGKSWLQNMKERNKKTKQIPKARIRNASNGNV